MIKKTLGLAALVGLLGFGCSQDKEVMPNNSVSPNIRKVDFSDTNKKDTINPVTRRVEFSCENYAKDGRIEVVNYFIDKDFKSLELYSPDGTRDYIDPSWSDENLCLYCRDRETMVCRSKDGTFSYGLVESKGKCHINEEFNKEVVQYPNDTLALRMIAGDKILSECEEFVCRGESKDIDKCDDGKILFRNKKGQIFYDFPEELKE